MAQVGSLDEQQLEIARERFELLAEQFDDQLMIESMNDLAEGLRYIVWFGPLSLLAELHEPFANDMRRFYWEEYAEEPDDPEAPVPEEQWGELLEAIEEYMAHQGYGGI